MLKAPLILLAIILALQLGCYSKVSEQDKVLAPSEKAVKNDAKVEVVLPDKIVEEPVLDNSAPPRPMEIPIPVPVPVFIPADDSGSGRSGGGRDRHSDNTEIKDDQELLVQENCKTEGLQLTCDDSSICTRDTCAPSSAMADDNGCLYEILTGIDCDDANQCTKIDKCNAEGVCSGTKTVVCHDNNSCTDDSCNIETGCVFSPNDSNRCDDQNSCIINENCFMGQCVGTKLANCCGNGLVEGDEKCDDENQVDFDGCNNECQYNQIRRAFMSSKKFSGEMNVDQQINLDHLDPCANLLGVDKADCRCQALAQNANLSCSENNFGCWKAWIAGSDAKSAPSERFNMVTSGNKSPIYQVNMNGTPDFKAPIATGGFDDLILCDEPGFICLDDPEINSFHASWKDEHGQRITKDLNNILVFTNVDAEGKQSFEAFNCQNWSSSEENFFANRGQGSASNLNWTQNNLVSCDSSAHLYCFEDQI